MDMNKTFFIGGESKAPAWHVIDARGKVVGRLATEIADMLRGKHKATYTPHSDAGDYVVVINAQEVLFTGDKMKNKQYEWYTGWMSGLKSLTAEQMLARKPEEIIRLAVRGMMPKTKLSDAMFKKLKVYAGSKHPHTAHTARAA